MGFNYTVFFSILAMHFIAVISPGPDFFIVTKNSLNFGRETGRWTAFGVGVGIIIHVLYSVAGLGILVSKSPQIFSMIKYLGGLYLIYIGVQSFRDKETKSEKILEPKEEHKSRQKAFFNGFLVNVLNIKATLYFVSIFSAIADRDISDLTYYVLGFFLIINTAIWFFLVATFFTKPKVRVWYFSQQKKLNLVFGVILIVFGVSLFIV